MLVTARRYRRAAGGAGRPGVILDVAAWAIPFGLIGAFVHAVLIDTGHDFRHMYRAWHLLTVGVAAIGVPGAVGLGALGAWIACRRAGVKLSPVADAAAPAIAFGLAIGGLGSWWTQQDYGPPSTWWWAVQIAPEHRVAGYENYATFQPVFLYQSLWDAALGFGVLWAASRFALGGVRAFALGAAGYAAGAFWTESLRVGPVPHILGIRFSAVANVVLFVIAVVVLYVMRSRRASTSKARRGQEEVTLVDDSSGDVMSM
jgi:prolipoprotein diacylglyceryltransferase